MPLVKNTILTHTEIEHKIKRIAYQIYESNANESELVIAGVESNGYLLARKIKTQLDKISDIKSILCKVTIDKSNPLNQINTSLEPKDYTNKSIVLIDDVLNSGSTLIYGIKHFLDVPLEQFKTAVLVNRNHKKFPVKADFKGISLSTSLFEHVHVNLSKKPYEAYLD
ncbi:phosphoribosyltransferase family protein [Winogradskyella sp. KYW1333]|jgi:pyrimidine operon attenuation protein/uracil phosphoribosyltransferase|uniref:phosphoribosyltransferase family protein n=1 Tax=Winogradskyella sp. KYW1333 TaxID=2282123 RepID=UPI000DF19908|nr:MULTISPECIES: phosphoribosyltransferase family protein [unclassified Winogradskyella]MDB4752285.1 phosphoribosyltransferase family protein [Winogradskyella sp.]RCT55026.1 phosphoribosyltransferase [Winogradskyella sp. KYW1333]